MANIELVVKISEQTYIHLLNGKSIGASLMIENAIKNGTPLPKGHGDLIDKKALDKDCESSEYHEVITSWLDLAPTIIGAYKESEEE